MLKKTFTVLVALAFCGTSLVLMSSCAKKVTKDTQVVTPAPAPAPAEEPAPKVGDDEAYQEAEEERKAELARLQREARLKAEMQVFEADHIYFDFDRSELKAAARATLNKKADWLRDNPGYSVRIEGHCDERGTNEYNLALGERRAMAAWKYLNALGISGSRMNTVSYGEEKPADPGHNEEAWAKNRRAEFMLD